MNELLKWIVLLALLLGLTGCTVTLKKDADVGFRFGTEIAAFHNSPDDGAVSELNLTDWVVELIRAELAKPTTEGTDEEVPEAPPEPDVE